jgi:RHS repeat-associated protein
MTRAIHLLAVVVALLWQLASPGEAATITVCPSGPPTCDFTSINTAILNANLGDEVLVDDGTYQEHNGCPVGFSGITVRSLNGPDTTIIDYGLLTPITGGYVVQMGCACNDCSVCPTVLDGFTIKGGKSSNGPGGISIAGGEIQSCIVEGNEGKEGGGIKVLGGDEVRIFDTIVRNNFAQRGGGIAFVAGNPAVIEASKITGNIATRGVGGGILVSQRYVVIKGVTEISGNLAENSFLSSQGGGISMAAATVSLDRVSVINNEANGSVHGLGGGIYHSGTLILDSSNVTNNRAIGAGGDGLGGGVYCTGEFNFSATTFELNGATTGGDDLYQAPSTLCAPEIEHRSQKSYRSSGRDRDPVNTFTGELFKTFTPDLALGGPMPLAFSRYYASGLAAEGITGRLGDNWLHSFEWSMTSTASTAEITTNRGRTISFEKPGADWVLTSVTDIPYQLVESGADFKLGDPQKGQLYTFDSTGKLVTIEDGSGNTHTLTYTGSDLATVSDGLGRTLTFTYSPGPHLSSVSDGTRSVGFNHTADDLTSTTDARGLTTTYAYATGGLMTSMTRTEGNTPFSQTYDTDGRVATQTDAASNTHTFTYDTTTVLTTTMTNPDGDTRVHTHSSSGVLTDHQGEDGLSFPMSYDSDGRTSSVTDRLGDTTSYTYHPASGKIASVTDADATVRTFTYTPRTFGGVTFHDLTGVTYQDGTSESFVRDAAGNVTSRTDRAGEVSTFTYNGNGQVLTATNPVGGVTTNTYNPDGTLASRTDPSGNATTFACDGLRRLVTVTNPDTSTRTYTYDANDNVITTTDERGNPTTFTYDDNDNLETITDGLGNTTTLAYDGLDRLVSVTDPLTNTTTLTYDALGRIATATHASTNTTTFSYDARGRLTSVTDPATHAWPLTWDVESILASATDPLGHTTGFSSDQMGRITQATSPLGHDTSYSYDSMGRVTRVTDPLGEATDISYGPRGLLSQTSRGGSSTAITRDDLGRIATVTDPNGQAWLSPRDVQGRLASRTDPLANQETFTYDNRNRVDVVTFPAALGTLNLSYDGVGNVTRRLYSDTAGLDYTYDAVDRLTAAEGLAIAYDANGEIVSSNGLAMTRDADGRLETLELATGKTVTYAYDARGLLTQVIDWAGGVTGFTYDDASRLTHITRPNGVNTSFVYDNDSRLLQINEGSGPLASSVLTYDDAGRVTRADRTVPTPAGAGGATPGSYTYDAASQVAGFTYDAMGRLTSDTTRTFAWDLASRLTSVTEGVSTVTHAYDALGHRVSRTEGGVTHGYVWNHALGLPSINVERTGGPGGTDLRYHITTPSGELLYSLEASDNSRRDYHYDETGNVLFVTNSGGAVIASYAYGPYGQLLSSTGAIDNAFTWQGQFGVMREGASDLYYVRARWYDSVTGRFLSRDPIRSLGPRSTNPYQYALGDPEGYSDPTGLYAGRVKHGADLVVRDPFVGLRSGLTESYLFWRREVYNATRSHEAAAALGVPTSPLDPHGVDEGRTGVDLYEAIKKRVALIFGAPNEVSLEDQDNEMWGREIEESIRLDQQRKAARQAEKALELEEELREELEILDAAYRSRWNPEDDPVFRRVPLTGEELSLRDEIRRYLSDANRENRNIADTSRLLRSLEEVRAQND